MFECSADLLRSFLLHKYLLAALPVYGEDLKIVVGLMEGVLFNEFFQLPSKVDQLAGLVIDPAVVDLVLNEDVADRINGVHTAHYFLNCLGNIILKD